MVALLGSTIVKVILAFFISILTIINGYHFDKWEKNHKHVQNVATQQKIPTLSNHNYFIVFSQTPKKETHKGK